MRFDEMEMVVPGNSAVLSNRIQQLRWKLCDLLVLGKG
jgi:hypothetical protein